MELWAAAVLFIACVWAAVIFIKLHNKRKKAHFILLAVFASLLALVLLAYSFLTLILIGGIRDAPPEPAIATEAPAATGTQIN